MSSEDTYKGLRRKRRWSKFGFNEDKASGGQTRHPQFQNLELLSSRNVSKLRCVVIHLMAHPGQELAVQFFSSLLAAFNLKKPGHRDS